MGSIREYFANIGSALGSSVKGMGVTLKHFTSEDPITVMYPHERKEIPPTYRGLHILEQEKCIDCHLCAKACPVDCIEIEATHHGRVLEWHKFSIDYKKCIFCEFCIPPCPVDCIHMTTEYELATDDPSTMVEDLLTWTGLRPEDQRAIETKLGIGGAAAAPDAIPAAGAAAAAAGAGTGTTGAQAAGAATAPAGAGATSTGAPAAGASAGAAGASAAADGKPQAAGADDMQARIAAIKAKLKKDGA